MKAVDGMPVERVITKTFSNRLIQIVNDLAVTVSGLMGISRLLL